MTRIELVRIFIGYLFIKVTIFVPLIAAWLVTRSNDTEK